MKLIEAQRIMEKYPDTLLRRKAWLQGGDNRFLCWRSPKFVFCDSEGKPIDSSYMYGNEKEFPNQTEKDADDYVVIAIPKGQTYQRQMALMNQNLERMHQLINQSFEGLSPEEHWEALESRGQKMEELVREWDKIINLTPGFCV
jgi:hypothetical protein